MPAIMQRFRKENTFGTGTIKLVMPTEYKAKRYIARTWHNVCHQSLVTVLTRCGLPLPVYFLADEKHSHCLRDKVYLPTIVHGRVIWHLGYTEEARAAAFTQSYQEFQRAAVDQEPTYRVRGVLIDGFDSTTKSMRTLFPWCASRQLSAPRAQQAPEETCGHRVPGP